MHLSIDAWLERKDPCVRLIDTETGQELLSLRAEQVRLLMDSGDLCPGDLSENHPFCEELIEFLEHQLPVPRDPTRLWVPDSMHGRNLSPGKDNLKRK